MLKGIPEFTIKLIILLVFFRCLLMNPQLLIDLFSYRLIDNMLNLHVTLNIF